MTINIPQHIKSYRFIKTLGKRPIEPRWTEADGANYPHDHPRLLAHLEQDGTYGVATGFNNLIVVDCDNKALQEDLLQHEPFQSTFTVKTAGKGLYHFYFEVNQGDSLKSIPLRDEHGTALADIQGYGKQVIGPGSRLATGNTYDIVNNVPIRKISRSEIDSCLAPYLPISNKDNGSDSLNRAQKETDALIAEIKRKLKISQVLSGLKDIDGIPINTRKNPTMCPLGHPSEGKACLGFNNATGQWHCFHCGEGGSMLDLYTKAKKISFPQTVQELAELANIDIDKFKSKYLTKNNKKSWDCIPIKQIIAFRNGSDGEYKVILQDGKSFMLSSNVVLNPNEFIAKYSMASKITLNRIKAEKWGALFDEWRELYGIEKEIGDYANNDTIVANAVIDDLKTFHITNTPEEALQYGMTYVKPTEPHTLYISNMVIREVLKKYDIKVSISKLRVLLDEYMVDARDPTKPIHTGAKGTKRFMVFCRDTLELEADKTKTDDGFDEVTS